MKPYRRKVASSKQWAAIAAEKTGPCRSCGQAENGRVESKIQLHHVVARAHGGSDTDANIIPLCLDCHDAVTRRVPLACKSIGWDCRERLAWHPPLVGPSLNYPTPGPAGSEQTT